MIISNITYSQNIGINGEWHLKDVSLGKLNLVASMNAVGKTRTVNVLDALVKTITGRIPQLLNGNWDITFENKNKQLRYILKIQDRKVIKERISENGKVLLNRTEESGTIVALKGGREFRDKFSPPLNKLTNQIRRDVEQYPFIEDLVHWAEKYYSFTFSNIRPNQYSLPMPRQLGAVEPQGSAYFSPDLSMVPYLLEELIDDTSIMRGIVKDIRQVGFEVSNLDAVKIGGPMAASALSIYEKSINFPIVQQELAQGMFRVIAIIVTIHYLMAKAKEGTIIIDDLGEGLDFLRSSQLASLIFGKMEKGNIQLIVTTNDRFLMNSVDLIYWNILERRGKYVKSFNYKNSREAFDEYKVTGISNFDFFANKLYKSLRRND